MVVPVDQDRQTVHTAEVHPVGHIKSGTLKRPFHGGPVFPERTSQICAVEPDVRLPVDGIEIKEHPLSPPVAGHRELIPIPEISRKEAVRDLELPVVIVRIRDGSGVQPGDEDRSGDRGREPAAVVISGDGQGDPVLPNILRPAQLPAAAAQDLRSVLRRRGERGELIPEIVFSPHLQLPDDIPGAGARSAQDLQIPGDTRKPGFHP